MNSIYLFWSFSFHTECVYEAASAAATAARALFILLVLAFPKERVALMLRAFFRLDNGEWLLR